MLVVEVFWKKSFVNTFIRACLVQHKIFNFNKLQEKFDCDSNTHVISTFLQCSLFRTYQNNLFTISVYVAACFHVIYIHSKSTSFLGICCQLPINETSDNEVKLYWKWRLGQKVNFNFHRKNSTSLANEVHTQFPSIIVKITPM